MLDFFVTAYQENPAATLEVFVHKAESLAEDYKIGMWSRDNNPCSLGRLPVPVVIVLHLTCALPPLSHARLLTGRVKLLLT